MRLTRAFSYFAAASSQLQISRQICSSWVTRKPRIPWRHMSSTATVPDRGGTQVSSLKCWYDTSRSTGEPIPRAYYEMSNRTLLILAARHDTDAVRELLTREVMAVDNVSWDGAQSRVNEIDAANREGMSIAFLPYKIGVCTALCAAVVSIPLTFDLETVLWFNHHFVTAEVAEPKDLETVLEVGKWAWTWMGPPLDQLSFLLLCLASAQNQMKQLGLKPYSGWLRLYRSKRLRRRYPQYSPRILHDFAINFAFPGSESFIHMTNTSTDPQHTPKKPTIEVARSLPRAYKEMSQDDLLFFAAFNDVFAIRELLLREIMAVDKLPRTSALQRLREVEAASKDRMKIATLPYTIGTALCVTAGVLSIPLLYHLDTVMWFNEHFVTADVAEPHDVETVLEVTRYDSFTPYVLRSHTLQL